MTFPPTFAERLTDEIPRLTIFCTRLAGSAHRRNDDLLQNTLKNAWRSRETFKAEASIYTWLCAIATAALKDMIRYDGRRLNPTSLDNLVSSDDGVSDFHDLIPSKDEEYSRFENSLAVRTTIDLAIKPGTLSHSIAIDHILFGLDIEEIAVKYSLKNGTARTRIFRAHKLLKNAVAANPSILVECGVYA